jgi:thiol-disulfide isomerase/thioredoxin
MDAGRKWGKKKRWLVLALWAAAIAGCRGDDAEKPRAEPGAVKAPGKAEIVLAPEGGDEVRALVRAEMDRAKRDGRDLVVYVGAPWCEPCKRFHDAVNAGELDATFPGLRLLEFDQDRDEARLAAAGYASRMIPLFVVPARDGEGSELRFAGSVKGERAVEVIVPRLQTLLAQARAAAR